MTNKKIDVIIIGGGPAGASTALYAARGGLNVVLLHNGQSALHRAERIENFYGAGAVGGGELYSRGLEQARAVGARIVDCVVSSAGYDGECFTVATDCGEFVSRRLVIATGAERRRADIAGLRELEGKGVSYCAVCDAFFYRKKRVGVLGAGEFAAHEYNALSGVVGEVILLTHGEKPTFAADNMREKKIARVLKSDETDRLCGVEFSDGETLALDGLFVALGVMGSNALCKSLGVLTDERGAILTDERGMTNIDGLYAAGDVCVGIKQIGKAVSDGVTVGTSLVSDFKKRG